MTAITSFTRRRLRVVALLAVLTLVASACTIVGDVSTGCDCPNFEATATSIDWIGDGTAPDEIRSNIEFDPPGLQLIVLYNTPDFVELQVQVEDRLRQLGFTVEDTTPFIGVAQGNEWTVAIRTAGSEDSPMLGISVLIVDDDARAAEILAPLVDALGTVP